MKETLPYILDLRMFRWLQPKTPQKYSYQMVVSLMTDESLEIRITNKNTSKSFAAQWKQTLTETPASRALLKMDGNSKICH